MTTSYNSFETLKKLPERFSLVYTGGTVQVFENRFALPRAFIVQASENGIEVLPNEEAQLARLRDPNFNPQRRVILSALPAELVAGLPNEVRENHGVVERIDLASNSVDLSVKTDSPGIVVLSQIYYPGWQVFVDGIRAPVLQPDYTLTGVFVKEGPHSVKFLYRPASLKIGMAITLGTILIVAAVIIVFQLRRPKPIQ